MKPHKITSQVLPARSRSGGHGIRGFECAQSESIWSHGARERTEAPFRMLAPYWMDGTLPLVRSAQVDLQSTLISVSVDDQKEFLRQVLGASKFLTVHMFHKCFCKTNQRGCQRPTQWYQQHQLPNGHIEATSKRGGKGI